MKAMKAMLIMCLILSLGCDDDDQQSVNVETSISITLVNNQQKNLLDENVLGSYNSDDIYTFTYNVDGGKKILQENLVNSNNQLYISDFGIDNKEIQETTIFLNLSTADVDTLKVEYKVENGSLFNTKLWYNDELKWSLGNIKHIEITK